MNYKTRTVIVEVISAIFILLFVYAALSKILDYEKFRVELGKSPLFNAFPGATSVIVPLTEIVIALLLIVKRYQYLALYISFSLMVMFSVYIWIILKFSPYIPCSCGGVLQNMTWTQHLIFNIGFVILGAIGILVYPSNIKTLSAVRGKACAL
ncbi:MauE/DoxX family redox-associated membrane protein [Pedobacter nutrimenti]|uniref:MauE/DoxX family redox-associated membrane protein n=1 Tax=Pedobacter nutrimenti TaxID=1241337 RepID=UPI00292EF784|nr:MauE/DoxX family redox-associated membrane protein [Pedobacter nutrimenti]